MDSSHISIEGEPKAIEPTKPDKFGNIVKLNDKIIEKFDANNTVDGSDGETDNQENNSNEAIVPVEPVADINGSDHCPDDVDKNEEEMNGDDKCEIDINIPSSNQRMLVAHEGFKAGVPLHPTVKQVPGKIYFVKFLPKPATQISSSTEPTLTVVDLPNARERNAVIQQDIETKIKTTNPVVATTSSGSESLGEPSKPIGHTVNLLNNNRILIKKFCVKNKNCEEINEETPTQIKTNDENDYDDDDDSDWSSGITVEASYDKDWKQNTPRTNNVKMVEISKIDDDDWNKGITVESTYREKKDWKQNTPQTNNVKEFESNIIDIGGDDGWSDDDSKLEAKYTDKMKASSSALPQINNVKMFESNNGSTPKIERNIQMNKVEHMVSNKVMVEKSNVVYSITKASKIKREFEQLSKTVNESKILSEFIIDNSKRNRRSGKIAKLMQIANNDPMQSDMSEPINRSYSSSSASRSASKDSDRSANSSLNSSNAGKRNTRSRNTDFSAKQKRFLKGIQQYTRGTDDESENNSFIDDDEDDADFFNPDTKHGPNAAFERRKSLSVSKLAKSNSEPEVNAIHNKWDKYCWRCHQQQTTVFCSTCIRSYHPACIKMKQLTQQEMETWNCSECIELKASEQENNQKKFDVRHFNKLLKYAMNRILQDVNLQQFQFPVNKIQYPDYSDIIIYPINLSKIEDNIDNLRYTNSEAFMSEVKWILHNCSIYFSDNYKVMRAAKSLQKVSKQEIYDIETCAECYLNANTMADNWFTETCAKPHLILWAKLKGFPFWPAKAMSINAQMVDVRFFGEHDRAHVPSKDCYLYSLEDPNPPTNKYKRNTIADCVKEVDVYIENIKARFGSFRYAEIKTPFNPQTVDKHLFEMIPSINGARGRRKSIAKYDLTLKIVKTADNHLSVVKKDQPTKELPQIKRTIDITGDGAISRTPTPPAQISSRRKTTTNHGKATTRCSDGSKKCETTLDKKSYQVLRRKSMALEKAEPKKVAPVIFKRKSIHSNSFANELEDSMSETNSNADENIQLPAKANHSGKKRKLSNEKMEPPKQVPEKRTKVDASKVEKKDVSTMSSRLVSEEEVVREESILSSVGLMKRASPLQTFIDQIQSRDPRKSAMAKRAIIDKRNTNVSKSSKDESPAKDKTPIALVPFVEIKEEKNKSPEQNITLTPNTTNEALSNAKETISLSSEENSAAVKAEIDSDEDSLMIIEDDFVDKTKDSSTPNRSTFNPIINDERLAENIARGTISVRDISKMTDKEHKTAKKSFPKSSATATASTLKPRIVPASARTTAMNNMVCIPLDGLPRLDLISNSAPPPLAVVSSANNISLFSRNQATILSSIVTTNEPPPLSISSIQMTTSNSTSNQSESLNSMPTITNVMITEQMASAITDAMVREPPKLTSRPKAPLRSDGDVVYPTGAGSVSQTLMENAHKMTDFFRSVMEDTMRDLASTNLEPKVRTLELELEKLKDTHAKEMADLKANTDRLLAEMKKSMEKERSRIIEETRKQCELERIRSVNEAKKKQWCAFCSSEAQFYCCWNTSYCSYTCQRKHWQIHMNHCSQVNQSNNPQQPQSNTRKTTASSAKVTVLKPDPIIIQPKLQSIQQTKSTMHGPKERFNVNSGRPDSRLANNNSMVPGLRSILPKNAVISTNVPQRQQQQQQQQQQMLQQQQPHKAAPASQSSAIIINRSLMSSWGNSNQKSGSLLHPNTILLSSSPSSFATISAPASSSGVSLLNANHTQKSTVSETIIIP